MAVVTAMECSNGAGGAAAGGGRTASQSARTTGSKPFIAALLSGVEPSLATWFTFAPKSIKYCSSKDSKLQTYTHRVREQVRAT